ncbi:MAG TPA: hypothetical protein VLS96_00885 [Nodosilinea sp.]|nr:hypothetical protein [Nodosilinea sp.]
MTMTRQLPVSASLCTSWQPGTLDQKQAGSRQLCPCCSHVLLRHTRGHQQYWRCGHCHQAMPVLNDGPSFTA